MLRQGWSQDPNVANTSHRCCVFLAAGQTTSWVQDCQLGIPSAVKQSTYLSDWRYSSHLRKFCSLPQILFGEKVLCHSCSVVLVTCFAAAGPCIWNNLPASLRDKEGTCTEFRRHWKHSCFRRTAAHRGFFDYCALWILLLTYLRIAYKSSIIRTLN